MKSNNFCLSILLTFIFTGDVYSKEDTEKKQDNSTTWSFYKVSKNDLFGKSSSDITQHLVKLYNQVTITLNDKILTVDNQLFRESQVCSIEYVRIKRTLLWYFSSQHTKELYENLFNQEKILLSNEIYIIRS